MGEPRELDDSCEVGGGRDLMDRTESQCLPVLVMLIMCSHSNRLSTGLYNSRIVKHVVKIWHPLDTSETRDRVRITRRCSGCLCVKFARTSGRAESGYSGTFSHQRFDQ